MSSYKFSKFFVPIQHPWNAPFWEGCGPYLPQILPDSVKIFTTVSIQGNKNSALRIFEKLKFLQKREIPRVYTFGPTLAPLRPLKKMAKLKKIIIILEEKIHPLGYPKIVKSRLISSPLQMKNGITFCTFWAFFDKNLSEVKVWFPNAELNSKSIGTNLKFQKNQKQKSSCAISYFQFFSGQFRASGISTPGPSEVEKIIG